MNKPAHELCALSRLCKRSGHCMHITVCEKILHACSSAIYIRHPFSYAYTACIKNAAAYGYGILHISNDAVELGEVELRAINEGKGHVAWLSPCLDGSFLALFSVAQDCSVMLSSGNPLSSPKSRSITLRHFHYGDIVVQHCEIYNTNYVVNQSKTYFFILVLQLLMVVNTLMLCTKYWFETNSTN